MRAALTDGTGRPPCSARGTHANPIGTFTASGVGNGMGTRACLGDLRRPYEHIIALRMGRIAIFGPAIRTKDWFTNAKRLSAPRTGKLRISAGQRGFYQPDVPGPPLTGP